MYWKILPSVGFSRVIELFFYNINKKKGIGSYPFFLIIIYAAASNPAMNIIDVKPGIPPSSVSVGVGVCVA